MKSRRTWRQPAVQNGCQPCPLTWAYLASVNHEGGILVTNQEEWDIIELEGDDGEPIRLCVERYFFYNGDEYVLLSDACDVEDEAEISRYVMKVQPMEGEGNEDMEEFVPVDEDLMDQLISVVEATFDTDEDEEE